MTFLKRRDQAGRLCFTDIRNAPELPRETGVPMDLLEKQIHAFLPDGTVAGRMDAIRVAYRSVGLGWLVTPTGWPVLRPCFGVLYGIIAKYRMSISRIVR
jgi:predicted DCC family thiol-disulfide oxidoreductase YuxK